ncbi:MAG: GWxTD domain-containing protein [Bacteroidota bacterium]
MKKIYISLVLVLFALQINAKNLQAYLSYATFYSPSDGPYIETYLSVVGKTVEFIINANGKFQATVQIMMVFKKDDIIKDFKKIDLMSPEIDDTSSIDFTFMDQQRFPLPDGDYDVEIQILDKNATNPKAYSTTESLEINFPMDTVCISGIQLIESYKETSDTKSILSKNGYDLVPFTINYYPGSIKSLTFYAEVYNSDTIFKVDEKFLVYYYIEAYETGKTLNDYYKFKKETPKKVIVVFSEFDISNLPSGNYNLVVDVRNKENKSLAFNKMFFQRNNPDAQFNLLDIAAIDITNTFVDKISHIDTLKDFIKSTYPVSTQIEKLFAESNLKKSDLKTLQQYFLNFWINRNAADPQKAWAEYYIEVKKVNKEYGTLIKKGYETERGRVYLQYGPPNSVTESVSDPSSYPYEIWLYYALANQKNRKFVFYLPGLVTNDYELMHSNAFGEVYDPSWQMKLVKRNTTTNNPDQTKDKDYWGGHSDDYYKSPH